LAESGHEGTAPPLADPVSGNQGVEEQLKNPSLAIDGPKLTNFGSTAVKLRGEFLRLTRLSQRYV